MIASIQGSLKFKSTNYLIIDVGGIGYQVFVPLSSFYSLPKLGDKISLNIHTHLKDDTIQLYGFLSKEEKDLFLSLIGVTGIGPKLALNILSGISSSDLIKAISEENIITLNAIPGVGKKTAERLILELRDKITQIKDSGPTIRERDNNYEDALSALINLGYKRLQAEEALRKFLEQSRNQVVPSGDEISVEEMIRESLKILQRK